MPDEGRGPASWQDELGAVQKLRAGVDETDAHLYSAQLRLRKSGTAADGRRYAAAKAKRDAAREALRAHLESLLPRHVPADYETLHDDIPLLLLPLRIETRFVPVDGGSELWVRAYPDDIAVYTHEPTLTDKEVAGGEKYWRDLWSTVGSDTAAAEARKKSWSWLADTFGGPRAAWIALQTKPTNWDNRAAANAPQFPPHELTKPSTWTRAPRTHVLPERLILRLYRGASQVEEIPGRLIPDELILGPDPLEVESSFETQEGLLSFGDKFAWAANFVKAVECGMAFRHPLSPADIENGFTRIVVVGVRLSLTEAAGKTAIERLIDNHHYSPKGFAILRQGTPTNNTEDAPAGYTSRDPFNATSYFTETGDPLFTEDDRTDGRNLADALGIDSTPLQYVAGADATDYLEAVAANTALYPGTLGYYFDTMLAPTLSPELRDALREFYIARVTGRGRVPAIRVGKQPYGVLLTSDFKNWKWSDEELAATPHILTGVHSTVARYHAIWETVHDKLAFVGRSSAQHDPSALLLDILGLQAGSVTFAQRTAYSTEYLKNRDDFQFGRAYFEDVRNTLTSKQALLDFLEGLGAQLRTGGIPRVPQLLRLVFQHFQSSIDPTNLIDDVPLSERDIIRYYNETLRKNYVDWLAESDTVEKLERQDFGTGAAIPTALLYRMLRRALLLQLHAASARWLARHGIDVLPTLQAANFYNIRPQPTITKWEVMRAKVAVAVERHPARGKAVAEHLLTSGRGEVEAAYLNRMRAALASLSRLPTARLERLLTEHIDTCSYRLDSWQNAMFDLRLAFQRTPSGKKQNPGGRRKGIYIGAYGWLENVKRAARSEVKLESVRDQLRPPNGEKLYESAGNGGFVHAPSLNHAAAAAVLRNGYLSRAQSGRELAFAVNLSSERIRRALFLLQGIRQGQSLEALLGYQFERELHDVASADATQIKLNQYIYDFRNAFPLTKHYLQQQGGGPTQVIPANNVVNGVALAEKSGPAPYGASGGVLGASSDELTSIAVAKDRLADSLDAVKDLFLSEGAFQMVQGNIDRAAAVLAAMKDINPPPEIDVINTPRSSRLTFTQRLAIQFDILNANAAESNPWNGIAMTARARIEPGLNHWLGKIIGDPTAIHFRVAHLNDAENELGHEILNVEHLGIQPIDLVYAIGNELNTGEPQQGKENRTSASELEVRIAWEYRDRNGLDDAVPVRIEFAKPENDKPLGKYLLLLRNLKTLVTDSRPLNARDFAPTPTTPIGDPANPERHDVDELTARVNAALTGSETLRGQIESLAIDAVVNVAEGDVRNCATLKATFDALTAARQTFADITPVMTAVNVAKLRGFLRQAADRGMSEAFPVVQRVTDSRRASLLDQARAVSRHLDLIGQQATALVAEATAAATKPAKVRALIAAGKAVFGDVFNLLPRFRYNNEADVQAANGDRDQLLSYATDTLRMTYPADEWLHSIAHVRSRAARWESIRSLHEAFTGKRLILAPIQLPYRAQDTWLALEFPKMDPAEPTREFNIAQDTVSITVHGEATFAPNATHTGLLLDDWTETVPTDNETTGIAFNYDQPSSAPPQALLLAVTPERSGHWTWDRICNVIDDTLARAKLRAVEPRVLDELDKPEVNILLPAILADFAAKDVNLALDFRLVNKPTAMAYPIENVVMAGEA